MTIKVTYDSYMDYVLESDSGFKSHYKQLSEKAQDRLDELFDGAEFESRGELNLDNVWINRISIYTSKELLVNTLKYLTIDEFNELKENDKLEDFINENQEKITTQCENEFALLLDVDIENDKWTVLY